MTKEFLEKANKGEKDEPKKEKVDEKDAKKVKDIIEIIKKGKGDAIAALGDLYDMVSAGKRAAVAKAFKHMVEFMLSKKYIENADFQAQSCAVFWAIAYNDVNGVFEKEAPKVIACMKKILEKGHAKNNLVVKNVFGALANLAVHNDSNKASILAKDGAAFIWKSVVSNAEEKSKGGDAYEGKTPGKKDETSMAIVELGLGLLKNLANQSADKDKKEVKFEPSVIVPVKKIGKIVDIMLKHSDNAAIQRFCCGLLQNVSATADGSYLEGFLEAAGQKAILAAMLKHSGNVDVQHEACGALCNLIGYAQDPALSNPCILPVIKAMQEHADHAGIQAQACITLSIIAQVHPKNQDDIVNADGLVAISMTMNSFEKDALCQSHACGAVMNLAWDNVNVKTAIVESGIVSSIVGAMNDFSDDIGVQREACGALTNLSQSTKELRNEMKQEGCMEALEAALKMHKNDETITFVGGAGLLMFTDEIDDDEDDDEDSTKKSTKDEEKDKKSKDKKSN